MVNQVLMVSLLLGEAVAFHLTGIVPRAPSSTNSFVDVDLSRRTHAKIEVPVSSQPSFTAIAKRYGARGICCGLLPSVSGANGSCSETAGDANSLESDEEQHESQQATAENDSGDDGDVDIDAEIEKLMKGIEHGSSRKTWRNEASRRGDMDEMKMVMLLRKQMGEEDFYKVFDPRNPRIGDI